MKRKKCTKCGKTLRVDKFYKIKKTGYLKSSCKKCSNAANKVWRLNNPEKVKATQRAYQKAHPEKFVYKPENYLKNKEEIKQRQAKYYASKGK